MIQIRNKLGLIMLIASYNSVSYAATIIVNTTSMTIDVMDSEFIDLDTSGRSGLYKTDTLTVSDLSDIDKNPADANSGTEPAISLPEAIIAANNAPLTADIIVLAVNTTYTLDSVNNYWYGPNALPPITSAITIRGDGLDEGLRPQRTDKAAIIQRDTNADKMRLFFVMGDRYTGIVPNKAQANLGNLSLVNLHVKNGYAQGGDGSGGGAGLGGAVFNQGFLNVFSSTFSENMAQGGNGGSTASLGGGGVGGDGIASLGGGFFGTHFIGQENIATASGETLSIFGGNGGPAGSGGFGPSDNNGINGGGPADLNSTHASHGAFGAGGGRAANAANENGNAGAFASGGGYGLIGGAGGFGGGDGQGTTRADDISFAGGQGTAARGGGGAGLGGAIFNHVGLVRIHNSTFSGNEVTGGDGGFGGSAYGAAIFSMNAPSFSGTNGLNIYHSTIFNNPCAAGSATDINNSGSCSSPVYILAINGAGVQDGFVDTKATIANSIIANPEDPDCGPNCPSSLSNNKTNATNGGSTLTLSGANIVRHAIFGAGTTSSGSTLDAAPFPAAEILDDSVGLTPIIIPSSSSPAIGAADSDTTALARQSGFSDLYLDQQRKPRLKAFVETPASAEIPATEDAPAVPAEPEVLAYFPTNIGAVETGTNTAPEIVLPLIKDEEGNEKNPEVTDSSATPLSSLFSIRDLDDILRTSSLDMRLTLSIDDLNGTLNIATEHVDRIRDELKLNFISLLDGIDETDIILEAPLSIISEFLSLTSFTPADGKVDVSSELEITINDLGNSGDAPSTGELSLSDNASLTIDITGTAPTVGIISDSITNNTAITALILFSEAVYDFDIADLEISNGTAVSDLTILAEDVVLILFQRNDIQVYQVDIQPDGQGDIQIQIPADVVVDNIGLSNTASDIVTVIYDVDRPTISTSGIPSVVGDKPFTARFIFNEAVRGFSLSDIKISNATLSDFTVIDASTYSVLITPSQAGGIHFSIKENIASDVMGNKNKALAERIIPIQQGSSSGGSYSPLLSLALLSIYLIRRRLQNRVVTWF